MKRVYAYSLADFAAMVATILVTLVEGVEAGLVVGVGLSIFLHLYATSRPHVAVMAESRDRDVQERQPAHHGHVPGDPLAARGRESVLPERAFPRRPGQRRRCANPAVRHVILERPAINTIDASGLESLEAINRRLKDGGITFNLSKVKGPVMDRLQRSHFLHELTGKVHLRHYDAVASINPDRAPYA